MIVACVVGPRTLNDGTKSLYNDVFGSLWGEILTNGHITMLTVQLWLYQLHSRLITPKHLILWLMLR